MYRYKLLIIRPLLAFTKWLEVETERTKAGRESIRRA
jgi:hypothetical protein